MATKIPAIAITNVCMLARSYRGKVIGDDASGYIDIEFPTVGKAATFCEMMLTTDNIVGKVAMCSVADLRNHVFNIRRDKPIESLFQSVTVTVRPSIRYPWEN